MHRHISIRRTNPYIPLTILCVPLTLCLSTYIYAVQRILPELRALEFYLRVTNGVIVASARVNPYRLIPRILGLDDDFL